MKLIPNLLFHGDCRQAFEFYAEVFQGEIKVMVAYGDVPGEEKLGSAYQSQIMHIWLEIGDQAITGGDLPVPGERNASGFNVAIHGADVDRMRKAFEELGEGGSVAMQFGPTPWSPGFGMLTDRFGTPWVINTTATRSPVG